MRQTRVNMCCVLSSQATDIVCALHVRCSQLIILEVSRDLDLCHTANHCMCFHRNHETHGHSFMDTPPDWWSPRDADFGGDGPGRDMAWGKKSVAGKEEVYGEIMSGWLACEYALRVRERARARLARLENVTFAGEINWNMLPDLHGRRFEIVSDGEFKGQYVQRKVVVGEDGACVRHLESVVDPQKTIVVQHENYKRFETLLKGKYTEQMDGKSREGWLAGVKHEHNGETVMTEVRVKTVTLDEISKVRQRSGREP